MKYVFLALAVLIGASALVFMLKRNGRPAGLADPQVAVNEIVAAHRAAEQEAEALAALPDAEIRQLVDRLFEPECEPIHIERLKLVGARAVPFLVQAFDDPRAKSDAFVEPAFATQSPFVRICRLLEPFGPPAAVAPLTRFCEHHYSNVRMEAVTALGNIGTEACVAPLLQVLEPQPDEVATYALLGIQQALAAKRGTPAFYAGIFPGLVSLLKGHEARFAAEHMLKIDAMRALPVLFSDEIFSPDNISVGSIIEVLNQTQHKIPLSKLLPFLAAAKSRLAEPKLDVVYGNGLVAYAINPDAATEQVLRSELKSPSVNVRNAAAAGLAVWAGVNEVWEVIGIAFDRYQPLTPRQQLYYDVSRYHGEVNNGGHSQYFFNGEGERWQAAVAGLTEIGATERAAILREAVALFGQAGPAADLETRRVQITRLDQTRGETLQALDERCFRLTENVEALLNLYAVEHRADFVKPVDTKAQ